MRPSLSAFLVYGATKLDLRAAPSSTWMRRTLLRSSSSPPSGPGAGAGTGQAGDDRGMLWTVDDSGQLVVIPVRIGISDGSNTVVMGRDLEAGQQVIAGFASDVFDRLPKEAVMGPPRSDWGSKDVATAEYWALRASAYKGIVTWAPTIDPEALKTLSMEMVLEHKARLVFHSWVAAPIVEDGAMTPDDFRLFMADHAIHLHGRMNPDFWKGTPVESYATRVLDGA